MMLQLFRNTEITHSSPEGVSHTVASSHLPKEEIEKAINWAIQNFVDGEASSSFQTNHILKDDERLIFDLPSIGYGEWQSSKWRKGRGKYIPKDNGHLILTNQRIVFAGEKTSLDLPLSTIEWGITTETGFSIARSGAQKRVAFTGMDCVSIKIQLEPEEDDDWEEGTVEWKLTGGNVREIIENLKMDNRPIKRHSIPKSVKKYVWQRDQGRCVECGSKENLEYDHIIPVSKGGSNTARNIQLLCEKCNRAKLASIQ